MKFHGKSFFTVDTPSFKSQYSQVVWHSLAPTPLPADVVKEYDGKVMSVTGWEVDVLRKYPNGSVAPVPCYESYNHHVRLRCASVALLLLLVRPSIGGGGGQCCGLFGTRRVWPRGTRMLKALCSHPMLKSKALTCTLTPPPNVRARWAVDGGKSGRQARTRTLVVAVRVVLELALARPLAGRSTAGLCRARARTSPVRDYGPNHLGLRYNALPEHQMALITSDGVPFRATRC